MFSDSFIESVLNCAALFFIPDIDDQLPKLLGYSESVIYKNYVTYKALQDFDQLCLLNDKDLKKHYVHEIDEAIGVQFSDYYLTNWPEQGSDTEEGIHFKPHKVVQGQNVNGKQMGHLIHPTNFVDKACLIRKVVWSYSTGFEYTIKPRIAYLRLEMINGEVVEIKQNTVDTKVGVDDDYFQLEGVFIITAFKMSSAVLNLRLCGSYNADNFLKAFDYYGLWDISPPAQRLLREYAKYQAKYHLNKKLNQYSVNHGYQGLSSSAELEIPFGLYAQQEDYDNSVKSFSLK